MHGRGLAIMSPLMIERELREDTLHMIPIEGMKLVRNIQLIYHKNKFISPELDAFRTLCQAPQKGKPGTSI